MLVTCLLCLSLAESLTGHSTLSLLFSKNVDYIVYEMYDKTYNHCGDEPLGTYITPVGRFVYGYLNQETLEAAEQGLDDYSTPDAGQYAFCTPSPNQNLPYYFQLGCKDGSNSALAVNIYTDKTCETRSKDASTGSDDSSLDASGINLHFQQCQTCVNWYDKNTDDVDDGYYTKKMTQAPMCSTAWTYKDTCGMKCRHTGMMEQGGSWHSSDFVLLGVLSVFTAVMIGLIIRKQRQMAEKEVEFRSTDMDLGKPTAAEGIKKWHYAALAGFVVIVLFFVCVLHLKDMTWILLLFVNVILFLYLMYLTITASNKDAAAGLVGQDSDDEDDDDDDENGAETPGAATSGYVNMNVFSLPTLS